MPPKTVVEVLRHASKSCVVKREFTKAGLLVRQAVDLAAEVFGTDHPKYADALLDYGFFLLYYDSKQQCVEVYEVTMLMLHLASDLLVTLIFDLLFSISLFHFRRHTKSKLPYSREKTYMLLSL